MSPTREYDLDFRKEEVETIMRHIAGASSCSLVGIGSVGGEPIDRLGWNGDWLALEHQTCGLGDCFVAHRQ